MDTFVWICQGILAALFAFSGVMKATQPEEKLVASGQSGVEGLSSSLIKFIGVSEILGALGLVLPLWLGIAPFLTPLAAMGLGIIMILAARVHYLRNEAKVIPVNITILLLCALIAWYRFGVA